MRGRNSMNKIKVVITDDGSGESLNIAYMLRENSMDVKICERNGLQLLEITDEFKPDIIITDAFLSHIDSLGVIERLNKQNPVTRPLIFVFSGLKNARLEEAVLNSGVDYYFIKPVDCENVLSKIKLLFNKRLIPDSPSRKNGKTFDIEDSVIDTLLDMGLQMRYAGFEYLKTAIITIIEKPEYASGVTKRLYPEIAGKYNVNVFTVEKNIRTIIDAAFKNSAKTNFFLYTGNRNEKPKNTDFILQIADFVRRQKRNSNTN